MNDPDAIAALATPPGASPRAIIRLSGPGCFDAVRSIGAGVPEPTSRENTSDPHPRRSGGPPWARVRLNLDGLALPALVALFPGPASATGEDAAEIYLVGNPHVLRRALAALWAFPGLRPARPGEFTARAYLNGRMRLDEAEGVGALIAARSAAELSASRELLSGKRGERHRARADRAATLLALVEAGIDFSDQEDVSAIAPADLCARASALAAEIDAELGPASRAPESGLPRVALVGVPNAGKSTLFNALLGRRRAVVSDVAGTTRDVLAEPMDLSRSAPGAGEVMLMDLPGLDADGSGEIDAAAQRAAREAAERADLWLWCDPSGRFDVHAFPGSAAAVLRVRTHADRPAPGAGGDIAVCSLDGSNLGALRRAIADRTHASDAAAAVIPRHARALREAARALHAAAASAPARAARLPEPEVTARSLREALDALGEIVGHIPPDEVLGRIFATFCVGK